MYSIEKILGSTMLPIIQEVMVPRPGFEPGTFRLGGGRSIQLSYRGAAVAIIAESPVNFPSGD